MGDLRKAHIPAGRLQSINEVFESKLAANMVFKTNKNSFGLRHFIADMSFSNKVSHLSPPPNLDQNREEILALI